MPARKPPGSALLDRAYKDLDLLDGNLVEATATPPQDIDPSIWRDVGDWLLLGSRVGAERIYVFDQVYDAFVARVTERVRSLRQGRPTPVGDASDASVDVGAMTMPRQLDILDELVADAREKGARVVVGGDRNREAGPQFFQPTVIVDVDHSMRIAREEQFGPVMVIMRVRDEAEAVRLANDCAYGLGSSVFTRDPVRAERISRQIRAGMTVVNDYGLAYMIQSLPFGGVGRSGFGRINGREGLRACCNVKAVVTDRLPLGGGVAVYPIVPATFPLIESTIGMLYSRGVVRKARAAASVLRHVVSVARARMRSPFFRPLELSLGRRGDR